MGIRLGVGVVRPRDGLCTLGEADPEATLGDCEPFAGLPFGRVEVDGAESKGNGVD